MVERGHRQPAPRRKLGDPVGLRRPGERQPGLGERDRVRRAALAVNGRRRAGNGIDIQLRAATQAGLLGRSYPAYDRNFAWPTTGAASLVRVDPTSDMNWNQAPGTFPLYPPGLPVEQLMIQWTGYLSLPAGCPQACTGSAWSAMTVQRSV